MDAKLSNDGGFYMQVISDAIVSAAENYNEAEIRFHVIDPIIRMLGYPDLENTYLKLEEKLEYPYLHIGGRSKKDVPLGYPDYRAGVKGARGSFVVEAKAGDVPITAREVEQAHSYAAHAQVGANYFMLGNGSEILLFETLSGPDAAPIVRLGLDALNAKFYELENVLSPKNLTRYCRVEYDKKLKLADGLRSSVRVRAGRYLHSEHDLRVVLNGQDCTQIVRQSLPQFSEAEAQLELIKSSFEMRVSDGVLERDDDGKIVAHLQLAGVTVHNHKAMTILGIDQLKFATADKFLSKTPESPTIFESLTDFMVSRGTSLPQLFGGTAEMEGDVLGSMFIRAAMHSSDGIISGEYVVFSEYDMSATDQMHFWIEMDMAGTFKLEIDT